MVRASESGADAVLGVRVTTDAAGETLLSSTQALTTTDTDYFFDVTAPTGGWTWAKVQALEVRYWRDSGTTTVQVARGQVLVDIAGEGDIYVATQQEDDGRVRLHIFDPGTDTWTTKNEFVWEEDGSINFAPNVSGCTIAVRSDGDIVIGYRGAVLGGERSFYIVRTGSTWSTASIVISSADLVNVVAIGPDSSDRITFLMRDETNNDLVTRSLSSTDVLGTEVDADSDVDTASLVIGPGIIDSGNEIYVPYIDASNQISVAQFTSAADPTGDFTIHTDVGDNTVKGQGASAIPFVVACLAVDGTNVHLLYANDADQDIYHDDDVENGGTTDDEDQDAVTANRMSCAVLGTNLDYVWLDGTTVKYNSIDISGAAPAFLPNGLMLVGVGR